MSNLKRFLALTLAMLMVVGAMAVSAKSFTDVASTDSYAEAVDVLSELGVILGTSTDEFSPEALVSREQMAMFIARLATAQPALFAGSAGAIFKDQKDPTYNAAIQYTYTNGIIAGRTTTEFDGAATVTLQEAAAMLSRALGYGNKTNNASYPFSYMVIANEITLLKGLEDVAPTAELTRGEVATMLYNALFAPKADRQVLYTPDGQDFIVSIPASFYDDVKNDSNVVIKAKGSFDSFAIKEWKCTVTTGAYINATLKAGINTSALTATKAIKDPITFNKGITGLQSFAAYTKFFAEDATSDDMLGVELKILSRSGKVLKVDVIGSKTVTTSATYNKDTNVLTVSGSDYNLSNYLANTFKYPAETDNCFYTYSNNEINRIIPANADAVDALFVQIANGFFTFDVINAGLDSQMLVYKPQRFFALTDANGDGTLELEGRNITSNPVGAVKDQYVTYFFGGDKNVDIVAKATKSAAVKVSTVSLTANKATLADGSTAPAKAGNPIGGADLLALSVGQTIYTYTVDGVVLKTELDKPNLSYIPNTYYKVLATADAVTTTDAFGVETTEYKIKVVDNAGTVSTKSITNLNNADTAFIESDWSTAVTGYKYTLAGAIITLDGTKAYTIASSDASKFKGYTVVNGTNVYAAEEFDGTTGFSGQNGVYKDGSARSFVLTDYSKIVIASTEGGTTADKYLTFTGKSFTKLHADASFTSFDYILYKNDAGIYELVYMYAKADKASTAIIDGSTTDATAKPYLFLDIETISANSVTYKAINLETGAVESITYVDGDGDYNKVLLGSSKLLNNAIVVNVVTGKKFAETGKQETEQYFKLTNTGYVSLNTSIIFQTTGTKYYKWNADTSTYDATTFAALDKNVSYRGLVVAGKDGNAAYVIVRGTAALTATLTSVATITDATPTGTSPIAWEITVPTTKTTIALSDIVASTGATVRLFTNNDFATGEITGTNTTTAGVVYIQVTSQDLLTVTKYAVTITRA